MSTPTSGWDSSRTGTYGTRCDPARAALRPVIRRRDEFLVLHDLLAWRDVRLPAVPGRAHSEIGMRRAGKTTYLHQLLDERRSTLPPERAICIGFDDDRLADIEVEQLGFPLEEFYRLHPALRGREMVHWFLDEIPLVRRLLVLDRDNVPRAETPGVRVQPVSGGRLSVAVLDDLAADWSCIQPTEILAFSRLQLSHSVAAEA